MSMKYRHTGLFLIALLIYLLGIQYFHLESSFVCAVWWALVTCGLIWLYELGVRK